MIDFSNGRTESANCPGPECVQAESNCSWKNCDKGLAPLTTILSRSAEIAGAGIVLTAVTVELAPAIIEAVPEVVAATRTRSTAHLLTRFIANAVHGWENASKYTKGGPPSVDYTAKIIGAVRSFIQRSHFK